MSYFIDLDEYRADVLEAELARRKAALALGNCDYCGRPGTVEPACKFPARHKAAADVLQARAA